LSEDEKRNESGEIDRTGWVDRIDRIDERDDDHERSACQERILKPANGTTGQPSDYKGALRVPCSDCSDRVQKTLK
jgi:hypothetical protein